MKQNRKTLQQLKPSDVNMVLEVLKYVNGTNNDVRVAAEKKLQEFEIRTGYVSILWHIVNNSNLPRDTRFLAIITLKNTIIKFWPSYKDNTITHGEKCYILKHIFNIINERDMQILQFGCLSISEILVNEDIKTWATLITRGIHLLEKSSSYEMEHSCLLLLYFIVKKLRMKSVPIFRTSFMTMAPSFLSITLKYFKKYSTATLAVLKDNWKGRTDLRIFNTFRICIKMVRELLRYGMKDFFGFSASKFFLETEIIQNLSQFFYFVFECFKRNIHAPLVYEVEKVLHCLYKIPLRLQKSRAESLGVFLPGFLRFSCIVLKETDPSIFRTDYNIVFRVILFLTDVFDCVIEFENVFKIVDKFFSIENLSELMKIILKKYFIVPLSELKQWNSNPENFFILSESENEQTLRVCAEGLYVSILESFEKIRNFTVGYIQEILNETFGSFDIGKLQLRNAAYNSLGWSSFYFDKKHLNFNELYFSIFKKELQVNNSKYSLIRKRVIWVIGKWSEEHDIKTRVDFYNVLNSFLLNEKDLVIVLTAISALSQIISGQNFSPKIFEKFFDSFMKKIFHVLAVTKREETTLKLINLIRLIIERMQAKSIQYLPSVFRLFQQIFFQAYKKGQLLVQESVIMTICCIIKLGNGAIGSCVNNNNYKNFILQLIGNGSDVKQKLALYATEETLSLWKNTMRHLSSMSNDFIKVYSNVVSILEVNYENAMCCLKITESYILLGGQSFVNVHCVTLKKLFSLIIGKVKKEVLLKAIQVLDLLLCLFPQKTSSFFTDSLTTIMKLIMKNEIQSPMNIYQAILLFARILLSCKKTFYEFYFQKNDSMVLKFLDYWLHNHDYILSAFHRKLSCMALLNCYPTKNVEFFKRFSLVFNIAVQVLYETDEIMERINLNDKNLTGKNELERQKLLYVKDRMVFQDFFEYLTSKMNEIKRFNGDEVHNQLMNSVDNNVLQQLNQYVINRKKK